MITIWKSTIAKAKALLRLILASFMAMAGLWESGAVCAGLTAKGQTCFNRLRNRATPCGHFHTGYGHGIET
jgi:hypothetical protein